MPLVDADRHDLSRKWVDRMFVTTGDTATLSHADIKAAVDAFDNALDGNQNTLGFSNTASLLANLNNILPLPFRTTATAAQKAVLLSYVLLKRGGLSS
jgi:hypothetical protein